MRIVAALVLIAGFAAAVAVSAPSAFAATAANGRAVVNSVSPVAGPTGGGTTLTVHGARFSAVESVTIGGKRARAVRVRSSTVLTVIAPAHAAGSATIVVREKSGTSLASAARYHYARKPRLTGMSAHSGPVTGGQVVTITGGAFSYGPAVMFGKVRATVLSGSTSAKLRVRTPASWAGTSTVSVRTPGGTTASSGADRFAFKNPASARSGRVTARAGDIVATGSDVTVVSGGSAVIGGTQAPWTVTLASTATVPAAGRQFLIPPGSAVYPAGLAGTVTAVDSATSTITVSPALDAAVASARASFTGPLGNAEASGEASAAAARPDGASLTNTISFPTIPASTLRCSNSDGVSVSVSGSASLTLDDVEAHLQVAVGSAWDKPYVDAWISYQPVVTFSLTANGSATCSLPDEWQEEHQKLFVIGDTGETITIAPDASFTLSAAGTVSFQQRSYRIIGFDTNADGSLSKIDTQLSDPAKVTASAALTAEVYGGVQVQLGELDVIGVGMTLGGGVDGTASSPWPPQVCLSAYPFLRGTLYAYLNAWVQEWKIEQFSVELDLSGISTCLGQGWHVAWLRQRDDRGVGTMACPTVSSCYAAGAIAGGGYLLRTADGGQTWQATTLTAYSDLYAVACVNASHCIVGGNGAKVAVTSNGGASWSQVGLPSSISPLAAVASLACLPSGTCYATADMTKYSGELVYASADDGRTWAPPTVVDDEPAAMTCLSTSVCIAAGTVPWAPGDGIAAPAATEATRGGWTSSYADSGMPPGWANLNEVACTSVSLCYASGSAGDAAVLSSTNFGQTWRSVSDDGLNANAVSCPDTTTCVVGGYAPDWSQYVADTADGGHSWTRSTISDFPVSDQMVTTFLACPSQGHCVAIENSLNTDAQAIVAS